MGNRVILTVLISTGLIYGTVASAEMATPSMLSNTCAGCHGASGVSSGPATPSIAGMSEVYFINAMLAYKYGDDEDKVAAAAESVGVDADDIDALSRGGTIMGRIAKGYSDKEIGAMAKLFAGKNFAGTVQKTDKKLARKGKKLHKKACEKCHEDGGTKGDGAGILAGQWMRYLHNAFVDFSSGDRDMSKKMRAKMKKLKDDDMKALVHYYGSHK